MVPIRFRAPVFAGLAAALIFICTSQVFSSEIDNQKTLPNFGRVSGSLFRGAQPTTGGISSLPGMGISIVVNFRNEKNEVTAEQRLVESAGMKYVSIPWSGSDMPSNSQIVQFLDLVRANPQAKIFVHCKAGADRTGVMVASYRIAVEHSAVSEAVAEMHQYHYHALFLPHLERYVRSLPGLLETDAVFSAYAPTAQAGGVAKPPAISAVIAIPSPTPIAAH